MRPRIAIFGATGTTGSRVARTADRYGLDAVLVGRDRARLDRLAGEVPGARVRTVELADPVSVRAAMDGTRVVVNCLAPAGAHALPVARAAVEAGIDHVDTTGETAYCLDLLERLDAGARDREVRLVPAVGTSSLPADFGAALALDRVEHGSATALSLGYDATGWKPSAGSLRSEIGILADGTPYVSGGVLRLGPPGGSVRRLPHGTGVRMPVPDAVVVSRWCDLPEIEAFLLGPAPGATAALLRGLSRLCAGGRAGPRLRSLAARLPDRDGGGESGTFTVHATVWGRFGAHTTSVSGREVYLSTARFAAMVAAELIARPGPGGVRAPSQVVADVATAAAAVELTVAHTGLAPDAILGEQT